jgi:hypothetical protein
MNRSRPGLPPPPPWWAKARGRGVPCWGAVCSAAGPGAAGRRLDDRRPPSAAPPQRDDRHRQRPGRPGRGQPVGDDAGVRGGRACEIATGLALRPAAVAGRLILATGGARACWSRRAPSPPGSGGSLRHALTAAVGLAAMAAWPAAARRRGPSVPWGLRPRVSAAGSVLLLGVLLWCSAELIASGGLDGLAERVLGGTPTLWPPPVVLSCRRGQPPAHIWLLCEPAILNLLSPQPTHSRQGAVQCRSICT